MARSTVASIMAEEKVRGLHWVAVRDDKGKLGSAQVEICYRRITVRPPIANPASLLPPLRGTDIESETVGEPLATQPEPPA